MTTIGGPLWPVTVIEDGDLEENGGDYVLRSGGAVRATRFSTEERSVVNGPATAVYIVSQAQVDSGEFKIVGNTGSIAVFPVTDREVRGKQAQPIFITEDR